MLKDDVSGFIYQHGTSSLLPSNDADMLNVESLSLIWMSAIANRYQSIMVDTIAECNASPVLVCS